MFDAAALGEQGSPKCDGLFKFKHSPEGSRFCTAAANEQDLLVPTGCIWEGLPTCPQTQCRDEEAGVFFCGGDDCICENGYDPDAGHVLEVSQSVSQAGRQAVRQAVSQSGSQAVRQSVQFLLLIVLYKTLIHESHLTDRD